MLKVDKQSLNIVLCIPCDIFINFKHNTTGYLVSSSCGPLLC